jgi:hypothetical protein
MSAQDTVARRARATSLGLRKQPRESNCGGQFHVVQLVVTALIEETVRVSSLVESLNSRPRSYFFLRRNLGSDYLTLLQLYLNHRWPEHGGRPTRVREDARRAIKWPASPALAQDARLHPLYAHLRMSSRDGPARTLHVKARRWSVLLTEKCHF